MEFLSENVISNFDSFSMSALGLTGMMLAIKKFLAYFRLEELDSPQPATLKRWGWQLHCVGEGN